MGLEIVELVIRFEEAFGIAISDEVATRMTTPREVADYIETKVAVADGSACLSQQAFYFLRGGFSHRLHLPRNAFHPEVSLENLIPKQDRRQLWIQLQREMGPRALPDLARPVWLFYSLCGCTVFLAVLLSYAMPRLQFQLGLVIGIALIFALGSLLAFVTRPLKTEFRRRFQTVDGLVEHLLLHSPHTFKHEQRRWTRAQVADTVRAIVVDVTGKTNFTDDSHFINDMHLD